MSNFSLVLASNLTASSDSFPVDFDLAWQWLGYSRSDNAKRALMNAGFVLGVDLLITEGLGTLAVPAPEEKILLSLECFKMWAMMAGTSQGKQVRLYFLECEKIAKRSEADKLENDRLHLEKSIAPKPKPSEIRQFAKMYEARYGKAYGDRYFDQMVGKHYPSLKGDAPEREEKTNLPTAKCLLTPTDIAAKLKIFYKTGSPNPQVVNKLLAQLGYQEKIEGQWSATDKAIEANLADRKPVDTNSKTQKDQLLWSADIIAILQEHTASLETNDSIDF